MFGDGEMGPTPISHFHHHQKGNQKSKFWSLILRLIQELRPSQPNHLYHNHHHIKILMIGYTHYMMHHQVKECDNSFFPFSAIWIKLQFLIRLCGNGISSHHPFCACICTTLTDPFLIHFYIWKIWRLRALEG